MSTSEMEVPSFYHASYPPPDWLLPPSLIIKNIEEKILGDFKNMDFPKTWKTKEGKQLKISEMDSVHVKNCIKMLERNIEQLPEGIRTQFLNSDSQSLKYLNAFKEELKNREIEREKKMQTLDGKIAHKFRNLKRDELIVK